MGDRAKPVDCSEHAGAYATFVCQHIAWGSGRGFNFGDMGDPRPDAWCDDCDAELLRHGGEWTDESELFAKITMLCSGCYDRARQRNQGAR